MHTFTKVGLDALLTPENCALSDTDVACQLLDELLACDEIFKDWYARAALPSRPGEFHPEPLTDPDVSLSTYPARATQ